MLERCIYKLKMDDTFYSQNSTMQDFNAFFGAFSLSDTTRDSLYDDSDVLSEISLTDSFFELDLSGFDEDFYK